MGPIRGLRRKRKIEKVVDQNAALSSLPYQPESLDWWDHFSKRITGPSSQLKDLPKFESVLKISRKTFNYICSLVKEEMMARPANFTDLNGKLLSLNDRVAIALRRLSSGESLSAVGDLLGINQSTVAQITWRFVEAMEARGLHHLRWPSTEAEMKEIKSKFERIRGLCLPNCCGSLSDSLVLKSSTFFKLSEEGKRLNGEKVKISEGTELREFIVGDLGFPLLPWLLTPYQGDSLTDSQANFNKQLSATRMVAQRALARLKETWRIIQGVMWRPDKNRLPRIILVCCLLHNIVIDLEDEVRDEMSLSHRHDSAYRQQVCESGDDSASILRDKLSLYLFGRLPSIDSST
ncbi:hypothetical protein HYC85_000668 [Camellia sinensis]|uniref:DDE Tnp4 domain-containing protein n=1 Tax=Camellia sinensis TaxID=4442 RepID=A0A7J7I3E3_CAMSI|nr:hypothetical protein HYC85_000668 [Camellia sinensis]